MLQHPNRSSIMDEDIMPPTWKYSAPGHVLIMVGNEPLYFTAPYSGQLRADGIGIGGYEAWRRVDILTSGTDNIANTTTTGGNLPDLIR